jgi:hypothetical protein
MLALAMVMVLVATIQQPQRRLAASQLLAILQEVGSPWRWCRLWRPLTCHLQGHCC